MIYFNAFIFCGIVCLIGQIILDNTKLTPAHLNTGFVVLGVILSCMGIYDILITNFGVGATLPITNFGHVLFSSAFIGFKESGITGLITNLFCLSSGVLSVVFIF